MPCPKAFYFAVRYTNVRHFMSQTERIICHFAVNAKGRQSDAIKQFTVQDVPYPLKKRCI